jgi:hypothetical protein
MSGNSPPPRARQSTAEWKDRYTQTRPKVERKIAQLTRRKHGGRCARVRGEPKVAADVQLLAAATNLARLAVLGLTHQAGMGRSRPADRSGTRSKQLSRDVGRGPHANQSHPRGQSTLIRSPHTHRHHRYRERMDARESSPGPVRHHLLEPLQSSLFLVAGHCVATDMCYRGSIMYTEAAHGTPSILHGRDPPVYLTIPRGARGEHVPA